MNNFKKKIEEIIYVMDHNEKELKAAVRAFNHSKYGHMLKDHVKEYLKDKAIEYGVIRDSTLESIPANHSSFHQDDNGDHYIHSH